MFGTLIVAGFDHCCVYDRPNDFDTCVMYKMNACDVFFVFARHSENWCLIMSHMGVGWLPVSPRTCYAYA